MTIPASSNSSSLPQFDSSGLLQLDNSLSVIKQEKVASISEAKKFSLDPSIFPAESLKVIDADTVKDTNTGTRFRFDQADNGTSFNAFETRKDFVKPSAENDARLLKQRQAIANDANLPLEYIPNQTVYNRGQEGVDKLKEILLAAQNVVVNPSGKIDQYGRPIADLTDVTGKSLLAQLNTPELNSRYEHPENIVTRGEDALRERARREEATKYSVSDDNRETLLGGATNIAATVANAFGDSVGRVLKSPALLAESLRETGITQKQRDLFAALNTKMAEAEKAGVSYTPTSEEQTILESPLQTFKRETLKPVMDGERNIAASDLLNLVSVAQPPMSVFQKLSATDRIHKDFIDPLNVVRDTAARTINTSGTDELRIQTEALANDAVLPSIAEGYEKFKSGKEVDGALQIADAVANYVVGTGRAAVNNKQAVVEELGRILPDMLMAGVSMPALFAGLGTETEAEAIKGYVKEHGVRPEGAALTRLRLATWSSAAMDSVMDKVIATKPGVIRTIVSEGGTEAVQSVLEQDAAIQDVSKIDPGKALSAGSIGAITGGGLNVAANPVAAVKEAANDVATVAKSTGNVASALIPDSVKAGLQNTAQSAADAASGIKASVGAMADTASNAATSAKEAVTTAASDVTSATTTPTVDPIQQSAQTEDHVEALRTLLRPENIAAATTTPEDTKTFVDEGYKRLGSITEELLALASVDQPSEEDNKRILQLMQESRNNKKTLDAIKLSQTTEEDTTEEDLKIATTPVDKIEDQPATVQAVERTLNSMRQPGKVTLEQAETFKEKAPLTPEQTQVVDAFIKTRKALATMSEVNSAVIYGKDDFIGMMEHQEMVSDFLDQGKTEVAKASLDSFKRFTNSQVRKYDILKAIADAVQSKDSTQLVPLTKQFFTNFPSSKELKIGDTKVTDIISNKKQPSEEDIARFSNLTASVGNEATLLKTAYAESELHFNLATKEASKTTDTKPVQQTTVQPIKSTNEVTTNGLQEQGQTSTKEVKTPTDDQEAVSQYEGRPDEKDIPQTTTQPVPTALTEQESAIRTGAEEVAQVGTVTPAKSSTTEDVITEHEDEVPSEGVGTVLEDTTEEVITAETTEVKSDDPVEQVRSLAKAKDFVNHKPLRDVVNGILKNNSVEHLKPNLVKRVIEALSAKPYKDIRALGEQVLADTKELFGKKLSDYYSAKKLSSKGTHSVLQTIPNFFNSIRGADVLESLGLNDKQSAGLKELDKFVKAFTDTFYDATFDTSKAKYESNVTKDPSYYFMKEGGKDFDENFVSTLAVVAYNWIVTGANDTLAPGDAALNARLGRDSKQEVNWREHELLGDKGAFKTPLIESLGKEVLNSLGIKFNPKADGSVESKMVMALGTHVINTLDHMHIIEKSKSLPKGVIDLLRDGEDVPEGMENSQTSERDIVYFVRATNKQAPNSTGTYTNTVLSDRLQAMVEANKNSDKLLTKLFGSTTERDLPLLEAPTLERIPKIIKRGLKRIPERVRKVLHKYASNPFTIHLDNHEVLDFLEDDQQLELLEYNETYEGVHEVNRKSVEGLNRSIENEWKAYRKLLDYLKEQPEGLKSPMYFMSSVWKSGRAGMEGLINPQSSKFHRGMLGMSAWESTIDSPEKLVLFKKAVAEAFNVKIGTQPDSVTLEEFDKLMSKDVIKDGVRAIKYLRANPEMDAEDKLATQRAILDAVKAGKHKTHTLTALTSLVHYSEDKPFKTRLFIEVDGVTNGIIIGLIQLMGARPSQMKEFLEAGAVSTDPNFVYGEHISKKGVVDNYQRIAHALVESKKAFYKQVSEVFSGETQRKDATEPVQEFIKAGGNTETLGGIDFFVGDLTDADGLTKEARDIAKNPLLITSYGAALSNVIEVLGDKVLKNLYTKLEKSRDNPEELRQIADKLYKVLKPKKPYEITTKNALTFKLNQAEATRFKKLVALSVGKSMGDAIKLHFQEFIDKRSEINNAMNLIHAAFIVKYDAAYKAAREAKGTNLTNEEIDAIVKELEPSMASFDHAMSDGEIDTELFVSNNDTERKFDDEEFRVQVQSKKPLQHGKQSVSSYGSVRIFKMPGVGGAIKAIHSSDGAVQYKLMENHAVLNVHDADLAGINGTMAMVQGQNQAFKEVMSDYSMRAAVQKSLLRAMNALTPAEREKVNSILQITNEKDPKFLGHSFVNQGKVKAPKYNNIREFINEFKDTTVRDLKAKKELVESIRSWGQYNLNHGAYVISDEANDILEIVRDLESSLEREDEILNSMIAEEIKHMKASLAREAGISLSSSADASIDTKTFVADMSMAVAPDTVTVIFDQLGKEDNVRDSAEHTEHLKTLLSVSIADVLKPVEVMVRKLGQTTSGVLENGKVYLNIGNNNRIYTTDQSAQEVYAHELVHHVTVAALTTDYWLRKRAINLFDKVRDQVTAESFLDYIPNTKTIIVPAGSTEAATIAKAEALYKHIFDNNDLTEVKYKNPITNEIVTKSLNNGLFEFIAMGTTNAKFMEVLKGVNLNEKKERVSVADKVFGLFTDLLQSVFNLIHGTKDPSANTALMVLTHKLAQTNKAKSNYLMRKFEENGRLEEILNSKLFKVLSYSTLASSKLLQKTGNKALSSVGEIIGLGPEINFEVYKAVVGKVARKLGITEKAFAYQLFNEMEGITVAKAKYHHLLAKSNKFIDQLRRELATNLANYLNKGFIAGKPSKAESIAITKAMLKPDLGSLLDKGYSWDDVLGMMKDYKNLIKETAAMEALLKLESGINFDYYKTQAASLGYMMVKGVPLKWGTKSNAVQAANLGGTGKTMIGDVTKIEQYIDTLASLRAVNWLMQDEAGTEHVDNFVAVAEREFAKDKDNNGIMLAYLAHKDLKARALESSFGGQRELMIKGFTADITNPRVTVITAPDSMTEELKARGYKKESEKLKKDPTDLNEVPISVFVNRDGDTATFMKMIVSLTSNKAKGTDLTAGYSKIGELNPALLGSFDTAQATILGQDIINDPSYYDLSEKPKSNLLVPIENPQHEIVGYRYLMSEETKDKVLEKTNSFDKILGAMEASISDKHYTKEINREVVKLMKEDFDANYKKDPSLFIQFGPNDQDADRREIYALLPEDMRREIKKVWKGSTMYVRADVFDVIFGSRKYTITAHKEKSAEDLMDEVNQSVLAKFGSSLRDKLRTPTARKIEIGLQELAKEVKDAIVIKSGSTLANNIISNNWLLWLNGLNRAEIVKDQAIGLDSTRQYLKDLAELRELERSVRINPRLQNSANVKAKIKTLKDYIALNPVSPLIDSGLFQTIVEDIDPDEDHYTYKGLIEERLAPMVARVPKPLRNIAGVAYMAHDTKLYQFMRESTQLSDFVARYALHKHNIEKKGMTFEASVDQINEVFINYDLPTHKAIQYLNDMNLVMFTKFFVRSQKIIAQTYKKAPARMLGLLGFENVIGEISTIDDGNIITTSAIGKISNPLFLVDEVADLHTLNLLDPTSIGGGTFYPSE